MRYCPSCGTQLNDSVSFCENCGTQLSVQVPGKKPAAPGRNPQNRSLHCPECRSTNLTPIVESTNSGGLATSSAVTRRISLTSYQTTTTHRNYWMCQNCGNKFRNLQNLKEELASEGKRMKICGISAVVFGIVCLILGFGVFSNDVTAVFLAFPLILLICAEILFCVVWLTTRNKILKMMEEKRYLEKNCFHRER